MNFPQPQAATPSYPSDDLGEAVPLHATPTRVISLVPSLTETIAVSAPGLLAGATDWCTHTAGLDPERFGGTKNPAVERIVAARPDLVLANHEENRLADLDALRAAGLAVWVTSPQTVPEALVSLERLLLACGVETPGWLSAAQHDWAGEIPPPTHHAVIPIWRRPWMAVGRDTFTGDVLARLGVANVLDGDPERYPKIAIEELPTHDLVVLPDEPYAFTPTDGPEAFRAPARCVSGRHLTWYGPSLAEARSVLGRQLQL